jgi:hypothetical protein
MYSGTASQPKRSYYNVLIFVAQQRVTTLDNEQMRSGSYKTRNVPCATTARTLVSWCTLDGAHSSRGLLGYDVYSVAMEYQHFSRKKKRGEKA